MLDTRCCSAKIGPVSMAPSDDFRSATRLRNGIQSTAVKAAARATNGRCSVGLLFAASTTSFEPLFSTDETTCSESWRPDC
jgi:hypothetical protein